MGKKIFEHSEVDASGIVFSNVKKKIMAAMYTDDQPELEYFDESYKKMREGISKAIPGMKLQLVDSTPDERIYLVRSYSASHPGTYYYYDNNNKLLCHKYY